MQVLTHVHADEHAAAEKLADVGPRRYAGGRGARPRVIEVHERTPLLDVREFVAADSGILPWCVYQPGQERRQDHPDRAHHEEDVAPSEGVCDRAHDRREDHQREVLGRVEDGRRRPSLGRGEPRGHDAAVAGERRRFGKAEQEAEEEQGGHRDGGRQHADKTLQEREDRPDEHAQDVHALRAEPVEEPATRDLREDVSPAERGEDVPHRDRIEREVLGERRSGDRECRPVGVVHRRRHEQEPDNQVTGGQGGAHPIASLR